MLFDYNAEMTCFGDEHVHGQFEFACVENHEILLAKPHYLVLFESPDLRLNFILANSSKLKVLAVSTSLLC